MDTLTKTCAFVVILTLTQMAGERSGELCLHGLGHSNRHSSHLECAKFATSSVRYDTRKYQTLRVNTCMASAMGHTRFTRGGTVSQPMNTSSWRVWHEHPGAVTTSDVRNPDSLQKIRNHTRACLASRTLEEIHCQSIEHPP